MKKNGIVIACFGTSYKDTEDKCITPLVESIRSLFGDYEVEIAFSSRIIIKILKDRGRAMKTPYKAALAMAEQGIENCIVQPLHFMKGHEYENKIEKPLASLKNRFEKMAIGEPLLSSEEDFNETALFVEEITSSLLKDPEEEKVLFMGHGTDHAQDRVYGQMQEIIDGKNIPAIIATVEGKTGIEEVIPELLKTGTRRVHLFPFMLTAGDHARNDMAGDDEESWTSRLKEAGIESIPHIRGMGEFARIRRLYIRHIRSAVKELLPKK